MKLLTKNTDYAVRALLHMAQVGDHFTPTSMISSGEAILHQFLRRILSVLVKAGLVEAREGSHGGVRLAVNPDSITLARVIELFQGDIVLSECTFRGEECPNRELCVIRTGIGRVEHLVAVEFQKMTLTSLLSGKEE